MIGLWLNLIPPFHERKFIHLECRNWYGMLVSSAYGSTRCLVLSKKSLFTFCSVLIRIFTHSKHNRKMGICNNLDWLFMYCTSDPPGLFYLRFLVYSIESGPFSWNFSSNFTIINTLLIHKFYSSHEKQLFGEYCINEM